MKGKNRDDVLVSKLDSGSPKRSVCVKVEPFCSRNLLILYMLLKKVFLSSANKGHCKR